MKNADRHGHCATSAGVYGVVTVGNIQRWVQKTRTGKKSPHHKWEPVQACIRTSYSSGVFYCS